MGISMGAVQTMEGYGIVGTGRKILDFGSSNLYTATAKEIIDFVGRHNPSPRADLAVWAEKLAAGSQPDASGTALNQSFVGELFEAINMVYDAVDIAIGYKTTVVDLNSMQLPPQMVGAYDSVINFGTSEHILNQFNVFAAIHDATKVGGKMMHSVPSVGYVDHGYFCYTSRFFFDLAAYNHYEVVDFWFDQTSTFENVFATMRQYQTVFPNLSSRLKKIDSPGKDATINNTQVPTISIAAVLEKAVDCHFMGSVEISTGVGEVSAKILNRYSALKS